MKLTKNKLKQIIREELKRVLSEGHEEYITHRGYTYKSSSEETIRKQIEHETGVRITARNEWGEYVVKPTRREETWYRTDNFKDAVDRARTMYSPGVDSPDQGGEYDF